MSHLPKNIQQEVNMLLSEIKNLEGLVCVNVKEISHYESEYTLEDDLKNYHWIYPIPCLEDSIPVIKQLQDELRVYNEDNDRVCDLNLRILDSCPYFKLGNNAEDFIFKPETPSGFRVVSITAHPKGLRTLAGPLNIKRPAYTGSNEEFEYTLPRDFDTSYDPKRQDTQFRLFYDYDLDGSRYTEDTEEEEAYQQEEIHVKIIFDDKHY